MRLMEDGNHIILFKISISKYITLKHQYPTNNLTIIILVIFAELSNYHIKKWEVGKDNQKPLCYAVGVE